MQIESRGMVVARVMCGSFMTSLEMAGFSISLMKANQETLRLFGECSGIFPLLCRPPTSNQKTIDQCLKQQKRNDFEKDIPEIQSISILFAAQQQQSEYDVSKQGAKRLEDDNMREFGSVSLARLLTSHNYCCIVE